MNEQPLTLEEIHEGTLEILKKIISICDGIGVNYFLAYGTLIGAVRHGGFIPWDDDLDLIMLRPDYEKFLDYCRVHEAEMFPFRLMNRRNTPDYPYNISRFCDLRYRMVSEDLPDAGMGMFIDIYPFDGVGNDIAEAERTIGKKKWLYMNCFFSAIRKHFMPSRKGTLRTIAKFPVHCAAKLIGYRYFLDKLEKLQYRYSFVDSRYVACTVWDGTLDATEKTNYMEYIYLDFAGVKAKAPRNYDALLRATYGDYMRLPPEDKRAPQHEYSLYRKPEYFPAE